ncbi:hypothetical protein CHARACLAT_015760 [Characodon lateralis]|uniref:Uncharacterized protein n=1 Tax=Characodon lateralis TaxID=208331 RepID=A0ABU7D1H5_9TELE|nr:hypothetical protein [Characodon lateralis]
MREVLCLCTPPPSPGCAGLRCCGDATLCGPTHCLRGFQVDVPCLETELFIFTQQQSISDRHIIQRPLETVRSVEKSHNNNVCSQQVGSDGEVERGGLNE